MSDDSARSTDQTGHDLGVALFFLAWAVVGWVSLATGTDLFDDRLYGGLDPGPGLMPVIVLAILTVGGIALAIRPLVALVSGRGRIRWQWSIRWRPAAFFASVVAFPVVMTLVGYVPTTLAFVFVWALLLDPQIRSRPAITVAWAAVAALATTLVIHVGFDRVIGAQLP
ncbi:MAG: tripartite tricarboxylate transporter TctB family protein [Hyphomicrobiales bacterium]|nr:tripartite tricarboxylate transporter TctB family protein [Hyphomicrobiales bacterium]